MLGPSGFFIPNNIDTGSPESNALELIHTSADGFSELYRGIKNGRFFVYKSLKKEYRGQPLYEELLKKDFNIGFSLSHPGICQYFAMVNHPAIGNCIIMEWIDGISLEELLKRGTVDGALTKKIICEMCDALDYIHRKQTTHRDLKPENIMITNNGRNVKIIDFGLSDADSYNVLKAPAGTRIYASPELLSGRDVDLRTDIWSLGIIIGELTGRYGRICRKCMKRAKEDRYASAQEVKNAILSHSTRRIAASLFSTMLCIGLAIMIWTFLPDRDGQPVPDAEETVSQITAVTDTVAVTPEPAETKPAAKELAPKSSTHNSKEDLDAASLDDLFNEAAGLIL